MTVEPGTGRIWISVQITPSFKTRLRGRWYHVKTVLTNPRVPLLSGPHLVLELGHQSVGDHGRRVGGLWSSSQVRYGGGTPTRGAGAACFETPPVRHSRPVRTLACLPPSSATIVMSHDQSRRAVQPTRYLATRRPPINTPTAWERCQKRD